LTPLKSISDFNTGFKFLNKFYEVDVDSCIRMGERSYKKYVKNNINHALNNKEKKFIKPK
jgi:hypothetical protein